MKNPKFAEKLKKARLEAGLTQKQVYETLGIVQSTFSSWETGKAEPSAENLIKLCVIYNIDFKYFYDVFDIKPPEKDDPVSTLRGALSETLGTPITPEQAELVLHLSQTVVDNSNK